MLFSLQVGVTPAFVRWLLYYGADARVLRPEWLANEVREQAEAVIAKYRIPAGDEGGRAC